MSSARGGRAAGGSPPGCGSCSTPAAEEAPSPLGQGRAAAAAASSLERQARARARPPRFD